MSQAVTSSTRMILLVQSLRLCWEVDNGATTDGAWSVIGFLNTAAIRLEPSMWEKPHHPARGGLAQFKPSLSSQRRLDRGLRLSIIISLRTKECPCSGAASCTHLHQSPAAAVRLLKFPCIRPSRSFLGKTWKVNGKAEDRAHFIRRGQDRCKMDPVNPKVLVYLRSLPLA